ncbi:MAG TPA: hypothetical protein VFA54_06460 [Bryobacterales bacterium]|jgi:hypothetical protein|nr:hypothetical protein [Bryobacterales bacterium]
MTILLLLLGFIAAAAGGTGIALWRLYRTGPEAQSIPALVSEISNPRRSALEVYQPMSRLFAEDDFALVGRLKPDLLKRLRRQRQRVLRLYLREIRIGFGRLHTLCRILAPRSHDPNFAARITQQALTFYGLFLILEFRCALGWFLHVRVDTVDLVGALAQLRQAAQSVLADMNSGTALAGSPA